MCHPRPPGSLNHSEVILEDSSTSGSLWFPGSLPTLGLNARLLPTDMALGHPTTKGLAPLLTVTSSLPGLQAPIAPKSRTPQPCSQKRGAEHLRIEAGHTLPTARC